MLLRVRSMCCSMCAACSFDPPGQLAAGKSCRLSVTFTPRVRSASHHIFPNPKAAPN